MGFIWAAIQEKLSDLHGVNILEVDNQEECGHHHRQQHKAGTAVEVDSLLYKAQVCLLYCVIGQTDGVEFIAEEVANISILPVGELPVFPHVEAVGYHVTNKKTRTDEFLSF